jgi:hypothetical protein
MDRACGNYCFDSTMVIVMKKAKTDKGWAGHKLFGYTYSDRDIRTNEDKYQDAVLDNLENRAKKSKKKQLRRKTNVL